MEMQRSDTWKGRREERCGAERERGEWEEDCSTPVRKCERRPRWCSFQPPPSNHQAAPPTSSQAWSPARWTVESRVSRLGALLQGMGGAPGATSKFLPGFVATAGESHGSERRERRGSTRSRMPVMRGLIAPQNTFLDTIATRFDGTREYRTSSLFARGEMIDSLYCH